MLFVDPQCLSGDADDGAHLWPLRVVGLDPHQREQMLQQFVHGCCIFARPFFDQAALQGPAEVEHGPILKGFASDQHRLFQHFARHHIYWPAHIAIDHVACTVGGRDGTVRSPEVDTDVDEKRRVLRVRRGERELVADFERLTAEIR